MTRLIPPLLLLTLLVGCGVDVEAPKPKTVGEIRDTLLKQVDVVQRHLDAGKLGPEDLTALNATVVWLRGHLKTRGGAPEQVAALDALQRRITALRRGEGPEAQTASLDASQVRPLLDEIRKAARAVTP